MFIRMNLLNTFFLLLFKFSKNAVITLTMTIKTFFTLELSELISRIVFVASYW